MNRNSRIALVFVGCLTIICIGMFFAIKELLGLPMYVDREIGREIEIGKEWTEITPPSPMIVSRRFQAITLKIDGARTNAKVDGIVLPDGSVVNPQVQISDADGNWYDLFGGSYTVRNYNLDDDSSDIGTSSFKARGSQLPADKNFIAVRIRSDIPFACRSVGWQNYNLK